MSETTELQVDGQLINEDLSTKTKYLNFITNPKVFFEQLIKKPRFMIPILAIIFSQILFAYALVPSVLTQIANQGQIELTPNMEMLFTIIAMFTSVLLGLLIFVGTSFVYFFIGKIFARTLRFRYVVTIFGFLQLPKAIKLVLIAIKAILTGVIEQKTGLTAFFSTNAPIGNVIMSNIEFFNLWYYFLLGLAVQVLFKCSYKKSYLIVFILFVLDVLTQSLSPGISTITLK